MSTLRCALLQTSIQWLNPEANFSLLESQLNGLPAVDLLILPETFATGFAFDQPGVGEHPQGTIFTWLQQQAQAHACVVTGSIAVQHEDKLVNRLYWIKPDGSFDHYDKRHLFRMGNEHQYVIAGSERKIFTLNDFRILPQICYDLRFPVWARNRNDYDVMINIANWPAARRHAYDTLLSARAIENQCYVLSVNRIGEDGRGVDHNGGTAIYDFKGQRMQQASDNEPGLITETLSLDALAQFKQHFPAYLDADEFQCPL